MDRINSDQRSALMSRVKTRDTKPELIVRSLLHRLGYRFRLHRKDLPGNPDLVFPIRKKVIFIHGCFWHGHDCPRGKRPSTNTEFWDLKLTKNKARDENALQMLNLLGWKALVIWECNVNATGELVKLLTKFLGKPRSKK
jgi:DNA mismatch endonuclease (patch repair protein)